MNLISALKKFDKVTKKDWVDTWGWNEYMYVSYQENKCLLYLYDNHSHEGCVYNYEYDEELMATDWIQFPECPCCRIPHVCGEELL